MPSRLNNMVVRELKKEFSGVDTCVFVDFTGLSGRKATDVRSRLRTTCGQAAQFTVVKTSLAKLALAQTESPVPADHDALSRCLTGPTGVAYGADDPVLMARTLAEWSKKEQLLHIKGGLLDGRPLDASEVAQLAKIPSRPVLLAQLIGTIAAGTLQGLLAVAQGPIQKLLGLAEALAKKKSANDEHG